MRKLAIWICENKPDQRLCFCYIDSTIPLLPKAEISSFYPSSVTLQPGLCQTWSTVGNQNGSFRRKYAFPVPFGGRNGSSPRKMVGEKFVTGDRSLTDR